MTLEPTQEGAVATDDHCHIAYRVDGNPDAPVLVLSNSLGTTRAMWDAQMLTFTRSHRVLRYDGRGHGASSVPQGDYSIERLGRDVLQLLDALGMSAVDFCGLSLGGMVGQWLGSHAPDRLRRLVLANTSAYMGPPAGWQTRIDSVLEGGMEAIVNTVINRWFTPDFARRGGERIHAVRQQLMMTSAVGYTGCCAAIRDMDQRKTCSLIRVPTLVVGATHDSATPLECAEFLAHAIPHASLGVIDAAHLSNIEQPEEFARLVGDFLNSASGQTDAP
jgi:3-oxoadipate enol-lactonase